MDSFPQADIVKELDNIWGIPKQRCIVIVVVVLGRIGISVGVDTTTTSTTTFSSSQEEFSFPPSTNFGCLVCLFVIGATWSVMMMTTMIAW